MADDRRIKENLESSRLLFTVAVFVGTGSLLVSLLVLFSGVLSKWGGLDAYALTLLPFLVAALFAAAAAFYSRLRSAALVEETEKAALKSRKDAAFDVEEDVSFTSGRTFVNYEKYTPYVLSVLSFILITTLLTLFWRHWGVRLEKPMPEKSIQVAFVNIVLMFVSAFAGVFCIGQSRDRCFRWLRPVGAWLIAGFVVSLMGAGSALLHSFGNTGADAVISRIVFVFFIILDVEIVINFITEFYRPRTIEEVRPVYESRILALFTEPGGVMRNISDMLDYQFGFKVSKTWLYSFLERALLPLLLLWALILWCFTGIHEVKFNETGFLVRLGEVKEQPLNPGVYLFFPYPIDQVEKISCEEIHQIRVGSELEIKDGKAVQPRVVLWTQKHYKKEKDYLVAVKRRPDGDGTTLGAVSLLGASIPVDFTINKDQVRNYLFLNRDSDKIVRNIAEQVVTKHMASVDLFGVMSGGREDTSKMLKQRIQELCDLQQLGVTIICVNLQDVHPPIEKVAPAFQDVINAMEQRETEILKAQAYEIGLIPETKSAALRIKIEAESYRNNTVKVAEAEAERFKKQLLAYDAMPEMFKLRSYLDFLERDTGEVRKYIFSKSMSYEIYEINLEEKTRLDLLDADLGAIRK